MPKRERPEELGPHSLPQQVRASQRMHWPSASVILHGPGGTSEVELMHPGKSEKHLLPTEPMVSFSWLPRSAPGFLMEAPELVSHIWPLQMRFNNARFSADANGWKSCKALLDRFKPSLGSKIPEPSLMPPKVPQESTEVFPTESMFVELVGCEVVEPYRHSTLTEERRWPVHLAIPRLALRSNSEIWDFSTVLSRWEGAIPSGVETATSGAESSGASHADVTIPKEMFVHLVNRAAQATFKESQVVAAREELQKAYIALAGKNRGDAAQAASSSNSGTSAHMHSSGGDHTERSPLAEAEASATEVELEQLRHKCAQLESSLRSQGLAQRRLETELASYQALARDELRQLLCARTPAQRWDVPHTPNA